MTEPEMTASLTGQGLMLERAMVSSGTKITQFYRWPILGIAVLAPSAPVILWLGGGISGGRVWLVLAAGLIGLAAGLLVLKAVDQRFRRSAVLLLALMALIAEAVFWLPFLFASYQSGQRDVIYAVVASIGTAIPVGFYTLRAFWPEILILFVFFAIGAVLIGRALQKVR